MKAINYISQEQYKKLCGQHRLTDTDKAHIKAYAADGIISFSDFIKAATEVLNHEQTGER